MASSIFSKSGCDNFLKRINWHQGLSLLSMPSALRDFRRFFLRSKGRKNGYISLELHPLTPYPIVVLFAKTDRLIKNKRLLSNDTFKLYMYGINNIHAHYYELNSKEQRKSKQEKAMDKQVELLMEQLDRRRSEKAMRAKNKQLFKK